MVGSAPIPIGIKAEVLGCLVFDWMKFTYLNSWDPSRATGFDPIHAASVPFGNFRFGILQKNYSSEIGNQSRQAPSGWAKVSNDVQILYEVDTERGFIELIHAAADRKPATAKCWVRQ